MTETDIDELVAKRRNNGTTFGKVFDSKTKQDVSYPFNPDGTYAIPTCRDLDCEETGIEKTIFPERINEPIKKRKLPKRDHSRADHLKSKNDDDSVYKWIAKGKTFRHKKKLKTAGFQWDKKTRTWYTFHNPNIELSDVIIYRVELHSPYRWVARGNTYPVKHRLKEIGMKWDASMKEWYIHKKPNCIIKGIIFEKVPC